MHREVIDMAENKLADLSTEFAVQILKLTDSIKGHYSLSNWNEAGPASVQTFGKPNMPTAVPILLPSFRSR